MRLLLIGATGGTGREIITQGLRRDHEIIAIVRSPEKLADVADQIAVVRGSVFDPAVIGDAVAGCDAVLSTIGAPAGFLGRGATTVYSDTATALTTALPGSGTARLLFCTSAGVEAHDPAEVLPYKLIAKPLFLQRAYDDMSAAERIIQASPLDWTLVRPGRLTDKPGHGSYQVSPRFRTPGGTGIPRADVASFMLDQIADHHWVRKTPTLTA